MTAAAWLEAFAAEHGLPDRFVADVDRYVRPLADWLAGSHARRIGLSGGQGTGKSTLGRCLAELFAREHRRRAVLLSLDDFYLPRAERYALADAVHPLFRTRGVPGTHDIGLLAKTLDLLDGAVADGGSVSVPVFDKSRDDRAATPRSIPLPVDIVIVEGWCIGASHETAAALVRPVNGLEREEDTDGRWRHEVNRRLHRDYEPVFRRLERLIFLEPPDYESLYRWRAQQEHELIARAGSGMSDAALRRFMQHYERLTRRCLDTLPTQADAVVELDDDHSITGLRIRSDGSRGS